MTAMRSPMRSPMRPSVRSPFEVAVQGDSEAPAYTPALKFNDARNSQYLLLFPWLGMTVAGAAVPANAMTLGGDPLTLGGEYLTVGA